MDICIIGNSHVAALKFAWEQVKADYPGRNITFFAVGASAATRADWEFAEGQVRLRSERGRAGFAASSGGRRGVTADFDAHVVCGFHSIKPAAQIHARCRTESQRRDKGRALISEECFVAALRDGLMDRTGMAVTRLIEDNLGRPVTVIPRPFVSEAALEKRGYWSRVAATGDSVSLARLFRSAITSLLASGSRFVEQPAETVSDGIFTKVEFTIGSPKLKAGREREEDDLYHMNSRYGALVLRDLFRGM